MKQGELTELIQRLLDKSEVGTLFLGKGRRVRQVFFTGNAVHLLESGKEARVCPLPVILKNKRISHGMLDELVERVRREPQSLALLLEKRGLLSEEELRTLLRKEVTEELLMLIARSHRHFLFEPGNVPMELLLPSVRLRGGISAASLRKALSGRIAEAAELATIFPSLDELPVVSEQGIAAQAAGEQWVFAQVAKVVDGFRTLRGILAESPCFASITLRTLAKAAREGWIKKRRLPELEELDPSALTPQEAADKVPALEMAAGMAVDEIPVRVLLVRTLLRCDQRQRAVQELSRIGDICYIRQDLDAALASYREALRLDPHSPLAAEKVYKVLLKFATDSFAHGEPEAGRSHMEEALRFRGDDPELYLSIIESYGDDEAAVTQAAGRFAERLAGSGEMNLALDILSEVRRLFPDSDLVRTRQINFLLDNGHAEEALEELEFLAGSLLDRGKPEQAREIFEKIRRLAPERLPSELPGAPRQERRVERRRFSFAFRMALAAFLSLAAYQLYLGESIEKWNHRVYALAQERIPPSGSPEHREMQARTQRLHSELRTFQRRHFVSVFAPITKDLADIVERRDLYLAHQALASLSELALRAEREELKGQVDEARRLWAEIVRKGKGTLWQERAHRRLTELEGYHREATYLFEEAREADRTGRLQEAFELYGRLLMEYPLARVCEEVRLPVRVESEPPGALVLRGEEALGHTPLVVRLAPEEELILRILAPGHEPREITLHEPKEHTVRLELLEDQGSGGSEE
ncbi:MAG: hypothetical protein ACE5GW_07845 [Planctomycetota bacterium]